jgi:hypothetical protein
VAPMSAEVEDTHSQPQLAVDKRVHEGEPTVFADHLRDAPSDGALVRRDAEASMASALARKSAMVNVGGDLLVSIEGNRIAIGLLQPLLAELLPEVLCEHHLLFLARAEGRNTEVASGSHRRKLRLCFVSSSP